MHVNHKTYKSLHASHKKEEHWSIAGLLSTLNLIMCIEQATTRYHWITLLLLWSCIRGTAPTIVTFTSTQWPCCEWPVQLIDLHVCECILHITKSWCAESGPKAKGPPWCACFRCLHLLWIAFCLLAMKNACLKELKDQRGNLFESHLYSTWPDQPEGPFHYITQISCVTALPIPNTEFVWPGQFNIEHGKMVTAGACIMGCNVVFDCAFFCCMRLSFKCSDSCCYSFS